MLQPSQQPLSKYQNVGIWLWPENRKKMMDIFVVEARHNADKHYLLYYKSLKYEKKLSSVLEVLVTVKVEYWLLD